MRNEQLKPSPRKDWGARSAGSGRFPRDVTRRGAARRGAARRGDERAPPIMMGIIKWRGRQRSKRKVFARKRPRVSRGGTAQVSLHDEPRVVVVKLTKEQLQRLVFGGVRLASGEMRLVVAGILKNQEDARSGSSDEMPARLGDVLLELHGKDIAKELRDAEAERGSRRRCSPTELARWAGLDINVRVVVTDKTPLACNAQALRNWVVQGSTLHVGSLQPGLVGVSEVRSRRHAPFFMRPDTRPHPFGGVAMGCSLFARRAQRLSRSTECGALAKRGNRLSAGVRSSTRREGTSWSRRWRCSQRGGRSSSPSRPTAEGQGHNSTRRLISRTTLVRRLQTPRETPPPHF